MTEKCKWTRLPDTPMKCSENGIDFPESRFRVPCTDKIAGGLRADTVIYPDNCPNCGKPVEIVKWITSSSLPLPHNWPSPTAEGKQP